MSKLPPQFPMASGRYSKQAHVDLPSGTFEEEHGRQGFFGHVSHLYHKNQPTNWTKIKGPLQPHAYDLRRISSDCEKAPRPFLGNNDVCLWVYTPKKEMPHFYRNADGDDVWFIHQGMGLLETDYGPLNYQQGDYLVIPRGTTYRFYPKGNQNQFYLLIESSTEIEIPDRGSLGRHAHFDPGVIEIPKAQVSSAPATDGKEWKVIIKRENEYTELFYPFNPLDIEGWKGDLFPWRLNVKDIRPVISPKYHLPPSAHTTLLAKGFVICTFAPRPMETGDPKAQRVPFYHRNIDYDEVIFYHDGDFFSRTGINPGMVTWHPQGIHHGPQPSAQKNQFQKEFADEYAVMVDTYHPLKPLDLCAKSEIDDYKDSWKNLTQPEKSRVEIAAQSSL
ncbi:MAG: homogentisate 1,2-dioxygenase [Bacteriovoracia bacterium]